jgi:CcmD family protein
MKSYEFLFWGYLVVWAGLAIYLITLMRRMSSLAKRLDALESSRPAAGRPSAT